VEECKKKQYAFKVQQFVTCFDFMSLALFSDESLFGPSLLLKKYSINNTFLWDDFLFIFSPPVEFGSVVSFDIK
jgi:hypothetical protein